MELPNPNNNRPFEQVLKDQHGQDTYGIREVDGLEEIVHLPTKQSNMRYWQPEKVLDPTGCNHEFFVLDMGRREIECSNCHWTTSFHPAINYEEKDGKAWVSFKGKKYQLSLQ